MSLRKEKWAELVDLLYKDKWAADHNTIKNIIEGSGSTTSNDNLQPIKNNLIWPILKLHDPESEFMQILDIAIKQGNIIIIDISLLDSINALRLSSMIVGYYLNENQMNFIGDNSDLVNAVFVIEEAQSVLSTTSSNSTFIELAKEGRKYSLGGIFITQQPGSISMDILSQGDNFFVFHLLSKSDLQSLQKANAHYSEDVLTQLLNEPIKGKSYMWTSKQPFVLPLKIINYESEFTSEILEEEMQRKNNILDNILNMINEDRKIHSEIIKKLEKIFEEEKIESISGITNKDIISKKLYNNLSEEEKEYCRKNNGIQKGNFDKEFAMYYPFLDGLIRDTNIQKEDKIISSDEKETGLDSFMEHQ